MAVAESLACRWERQEGNVAAVVRAAAEAAAAAARATAATALLQAEAWGSSEGRRCIPSTH